MVLAVISVFGRQRQEGIFEFEVSLSDLHNEFQARQGYMMSEKKKQAPLFCFLIFNLQWSHFICKIL